jgi:HlyD family secretion protein
MKRWMIAGGIVVAVLIALGLRGLGGNGATSFRFVAVERGDLESVISSTGILQPTKTVEVGTQVSGQIAEIYVDFNDHVKAGQLIARIDPTILGQEVESAAANVDRSRAELDHATRELERIRRLHDTQVTTDSELEAAEYSEAVARASLKSAEIGLERARRNLSYSEIRAPIDGVVIDRTVDVGQTVAASLSAPQLFLIAQDLESMEILASVDESDIGQIEEGQAVRFTVQAYPDASFEGRVRQIRLQSTIEENVVNYGVVVQVDNTDLRLLPGMTATVAFIVERLTDVLKVSNAALRFRPTEAMREALRARRRTAAPAVRGDSAAATGGSAARGGRRHDGGTDGRGAGAGRGDRTLLWFVDPDGRVDATPVRTLLSDGQETAIEGRGIAAGLQCIAAVTTTSAPTASNPFQNQERRRPRRGPGF